MATLTRIEFIKTTSMAALALAAAGLSIGNNKVFAADNLSVKTRYGTFNGFIDKNGIKTWLGIPFAQLPVGKLRWRAPQMLKPSNKSFDAKKFGFTACQEVDENEVASVNPQSEDCLTLNIWTRGNGKNYLFSEQSPDEKLRSCHAIDLTYTFNVGDHIVPNLNPTFVKQVQASLTAFAATGNPNNEFIPHREKYSADNRQTMELNSKGCICHKDLNTQNLNALRYIYEN